MPRFAANLTMMFNERPFLDRFEAAAQAGFKGVEILLPYEFAAEQIAERLQQHGLQQALFNLPPGRWEEGERGLASLPGRESEFQDAVGIALDYAAILDCPLLHVMAGIPRDTPWEAAFNTYVRNLKFAAKKVDEAGRGIVIEPINTRDIPGYFLNYAADAARAIEAVAAPNIGLQLDLYHCQIMEGDLATHIRHFSAITRHMQIAGVPARHEPDVGEVNYPYLFDLIDEIGYEGWIGCEYHPAGETIDGLGWFKNATR